MDAQKRPYHSNCRQTQPIYRARRHATWHSIQTRTHHALPHGGLVDSSYFFNPLSKTTTMNAWEQTIHRPVLTLYHDESKYISRTQILLIAQKRS